MRNAKIARPMMVRPRLRMLGLLAFSVTTIQSCLSAELDSQLADMQKILNAQRIEIRNQRQDFDILLKVRRGEYFAAISDYTAIIETSSDASRIGSSHVARGRVFAQLGNYIRAQEDMLQGINLNPVSENYVARADFYFNIGRFADAFSDYNSAIGLGLARSESGFQSARWYSSRGAAFVKRNKLELALQDIEEALRLNPNSASLTVFKSNRLAERATILGAMARYDLAFKEFEEAIKLSPNNATVFVRRGDLYIQRGEYDLALKEFATAIQLDPEYTPVYQSRGVAFFHQRQFDDSRQDWIRRLELRPADSLAILWLYLARARQGEDGRPDLIEQSKRVAPSHWHRAVMDRFLDVSDDVTLFEAVKDPDSEIERDQHAKASFYLGQYALLRGDHAKAVQFFTSVLDTGVPPSIEVSGAREELRRLGR